MRNFIISILLSYFGFTSINYAADAIDIEIKAVQPTALEQQDAAWSDMHNLAETRTEWYKENLAILKNSSLESSERANLAKKIMPYHESTVETIIANKSKTTDRSRLSTNLQKRTKELCLINVVSVDLSYSFLYWDFLSRVLSFYSTPLNSTPEMRSAVLPHLVRELINFDEFAVEDIQGDNRCRYALEEFYINRAIYEECKDLAVSYAIQIDNMMQVKHAQEDVARDLELSEIAQLETVTLGGETTKASNKLPYFMEQIIFHKKQAPSDTSPPDLNKGRFLSFQRYILPSTGPIYIKEAPLRSESFLPLNSNATRAHKKKTIKKPPTAKRKQNDKKQGSFPKQEQKDKHDLTYSDSESAASSQSTITHSTVEAKADLNIESDDETPAEAADLPHAKAIDKKPTPILRDTTSASSTTTPINTPTQRALVRQPTLLKSLTNIRDVRLHFQHRSSPSYVFQGMEYPFPIGKEDLRSFDPRFLGEIKRMTHLSPSTDKLPNIALGAITFHYQMDNVDLAKTIKLKELFLSGGKYFDQGDFDFKARHNIINGLQDILTPEDKKTVSSLRHPDKSIQLGIRMEKYLRRHVIEGPWKNNCLDSEAIFALFLVKKLPTLVMSYFKTDADHPVTFKGAVIAISSYRDCCPKCQQLLQGLQWRLGEIILGYNIPHLYVDKTFSTLAIVKGHARLTGEKYVHEMPILEKGLTTLGKGHILVNIPYDKG